MKHFKMAFYAIFFMNYIFLNSGYFESIPVLGFYLPYISCFDKKNYGIIFTVL